MSISILRCYSTLCRARSPLIVISTVRRSRSSGRGLIFTCIINERGWAQSQRDGSGQLVENLYRRFAKDHSFLQCIIEKAFFFQLAQMIQQVVVESAGIE